MTVTFKPGSPIWCSGCGHFGVEAALKQSLRNLSIEPHEAMVLAGIGCSGTIQNYIGCYGYHALHGRVLPTATGVAAANPGLTVIAAGGDGDGYAIGCGHLVHTIRRNPSLLYIVMNNGTYGLTKGQPSPTAAERPDQEHAIDAIQLALTIPGSTFLARGYVGEMKQLVSLVDAGLTHVREKRGFAFLEIISPCVTFNDNFPTWRELLARLDGDESHDCSNRAAVIGSYARLVDAGRLPTGLIYQGCASTFEEAIGVTVENSPAFQDLSLSCHLDGYRKHMDMYAM